MRKSVSAAPKSTTSDLGQQWLDIKALASVELTSEDAAHPFENALEERNGKQWMASVPGPQTIRLVFDKPQAVMRIHLVVREESRARTQEFALFATSGDGVRTEVVRQQWSFSPDSSTLESEQYAVDLPELLTLELQIDPGRHDKSALASLEFIGLS